MCSIWKTGNTDNIWKTGVHGELSILIYSVMKEKVQEYII